MDCHLIPVTNRYTRKRRKNTENWKKNVNKKLRYSAKALPIRVCTHDTKSLKCCKLEMNQLMRLHQAFYTSNKKADQDALILKHCSIVPVKQKLSYKAKKQTTIKYSVFIKQNKFPICQKFFLLIFGITKHRVSYVLNRFYYTGEALTEHRGGDRLSLKNAEKRNSIRSFIQKLNCIESHYCRKTKSAERKYLPSELNIKKLYDMYVKSEYFYRGSKQSYFRNIFNNYYNIGFGSPKTDVCSVCLQLSEKIKAETDTPKKIQLITEKRIHGLRAKAFFDKLREEREGLITISFDCQKNLPLPKLQDQITYYSRQLYFFNLTMVVGSSKTSLGKDRVFAYCCTENQFNKDSNLVASALYHRLLQIDKTGIRNIRLVADGCGGQNKNCIVLGACSKWLLENQDMSSIELVFPVTGHSYMPADRQFGIIEKKLRKMETIIHPDQIIDVISETSTIIKLGSDCPVKDWRSSVKNVVKDTTSWPIKFKECKRFILKRSKKEGNVLIRGELFYKSDLGKAVNVCQRQKNTAMINPQEIGNIKPLNKKKLQDVEMLLKKHFGDDWVDVPILSFYKDVLSSQSALAAPSTETNYCEELLTDTSELRV